MLCSSVHWLVDLAVWVYAVNVLEAAFITRISPQGSIFSALPTLPFSNTERTRDRGNNGALATAAVAVVNARAAHQVANPLDNSDSNLPRQGLERVESSGHQLINRPLCRTPPPVYNCLPATPPPCYTPRRTERERQGQGAEVLGLQRHRSAESGTGAEAEVARVAAEEVNVRQRQLARRVENLANRNERPEEQHVQHQHQRQRRRQRLQLLQQQARVSNIFLNLNPHIASSSSSSDSDSDAATAAASGLRRQSLHRLRGLRDVYCPDLLHACSLILHQPQTSDSSVGSFTDTLPSLDHTSDYVEIDEIRQGRHSTNDHDHEARQDLRQPTGDALARVEDLTVNQRQEGREMGQNLSLRRPRISLTWVLREQHQQQTQQQQQPDNAKQQDEKQASEPKVEPQNNNNGYANGHVDKQPSHLDAPKKRYRIKQLPGSTDPLNGYATTPTTHSAAVAPQKFFSNQNLLDYKEKSRAPSKELLFVCTPQRLPKSYETSDALALAKKRNEIRKKLAAKMAALQASGGRTGDGAEACQPAASGGVLEKDELKSLKGTYSEPSLIAASEGNHRRHRHRKRRERNRIPKFGYEISNVDDFLAKCSLAAPANIPVVLSTSSTLYQTRPGGYQVEIPLPLGMVVNAVFKNQNWLYVQTPHAEEGYVGYACCLPLGILPPAARGASSSSKPTPCWESNGDIFPRPCGNMTDSEKEIRFNGGTRSDGARTPRGKRAESLQTDVDTMNGNLHYGEHHVDKLYLRAASQPKLVEKAYAQLKLTKNASMRSGNDEYVVLQQQQHQKTKLHVQKHLQQQQQLQVMHSKQIVNGPFITNGHNGQHLHPKGANLHATTANTTASTTAPHVASNANLHQTVVNAVRKQHGLRQTLVAINTDYSTDSITLKKGEIVTLCQCRESNDRRQWFYVKTRDGREGYIPAEVAGHGYL